MEQKMKHILNEAINTFGEDMQLNVAVEEFSELTKEICKHKRGADNKQNIIEEMADCRIMLEQMKIIFGINDISLSREIHRKIERLKNTLTKN
jgi:hypothetical protein